MADQQLPKRQRPRLPHLLLPTQILHALLKLLLACSNFLFLLFWFVRRESQESQNRGDLQSEKGESLLRKGRQPLLDLGNCLPHTTLL
ncbi:hypothetical protein NMY22_g5881 [Coprinellus aureogranulatus]|nr:hypothetical protein NMY22_g5881 [Coprinellus aureogranulatus]